MLSRWILTTVVIGALVAAPFVLADDFVRGDANQDFKVDVADAAMILAVLFQAYDLPCLDSGDVNDDGTINIADPIYLLTYMFAEGSAPPAPSGHGSESCGPDPTPDPLDCADSPCE